MSSTRPAATTGHASRQPLDTPEVVEIDLADGRITGRSPARGGTIPGNLVAYRGEVISQGIDSLDVFHQVAPLEGRIETAANARPDDPWALLWRGQLALDGGRVADGLRAISAARRADPARIPAELVADALLFGMRRDFAAAAPLWREISETAGPLPRSKALLCIAIDNQIAAGAVDEAWRSCRALLELPPAVGADDDWLIGDVADPALVIAEPRWLRGRIGDLLAKASPALHREIDTFVAAALAEARADDAEDPPDALARLSLCFAAHPAAATARRMLLEALDERLASRAIPRDTARTLALERELLRREIAAGAPAPAAAGTTTRGAWPLGRVAVHRGGRARPEEQMRLSRMIPVPVDPRSESDVPGLQIGCDVQSQALVVSDGVGRRLGDPIPCDAGPRRRSRRAPATARRSRSAGRARRSPSGGRPGGAPTAVAGERCRRPATRTSPLRHPDRPRWRPPQAQRQTRARHRGVGARHAGRRPEGPRHAAAGERGGAPGRPDARVS
ncbi:MAG: hypothetical protein EBZ74_04880 [Planctomycetia bacterium]|nr:hypothetical protein [Planctomycetia bacterium]